MGVVQKVGRPPGTLSAPAGPTQDAARRLFGITVFVSSQISIAETQGSSNDCSFVVVVDMSQVVVGVRTTNAVLYNPFSYASTGRSK